jgi:hypothetical protein
MNKHLRNYFKSQRERKGIRMGHLAEMIGYKNRNKGGRLILQFEREGIVSEDLLQKLITALEIDQEALAEAIKRDQDEWEAWVNEPVPMQMILRPIAAVNILHPLPQEIETVEQAEKYSRNYAKEKGFRVCLVLSRRESLWIRDNGEISARTFAKPGVPNIPYTTVGGTQKFLFREGERGLQPVVVRQVRRE